MLTRSGNQPDAWHIMKHPIYIYILARVLYEKNVSDDFRVKDRLNSLNMALHSCSIYYKVALPRVFFLNYATQVVLGDCTYGENLVVYQGVTVGGYRNKVPVLGQNVVLMPNSVIAGATTLGNNVVVSAGVAVINKIVPDDTIVFAGGPNGELIYHPLKNNQYIDYFVSTPQ